MGSTLQVGLRGRQAVRCRRSVAVAAATVAVTAALGVPAATVDAAVVVTSPTGPFSVNGVPVSLAGSATTGHPYKPGVVAAGDTFSFAIAGFNNSSGDGIYVTSNSGSGVLTATFGTTQSFANGAISGQTLTVASSESVTPTLTTDTVTLSVPSTFVTAGTTFNGSISGETVNLLEFDLGAFNGGSNPVNFALPINPATNTTSGSITYGSANTVFALNGFPVFGAGGTSFADAEGISAGTADIGALGIHQFTVSVSYATVAVPEPATATVAVAAAAVVAGGRRRRRPGNPRGRSGGGPVTS